MKRVLELNFTFEVDDKTLKFKKLPIKGGKKELDGYALNMQSDNNTITFDLSRKDGKVMDLKTAVYDVHMPLINAGSVLVPDSGRFYQKNIWPRQIWVENPKFKLAGRSFGNPFFAVANMMDELEIAFGLMGSLIETEVFFYSPGASKKNTLLASGEKSKVLFTKPIGEGLTIGKMKTFKDGFFVSEKEDFVKDKRSWFFALREYGKAFTKMKKAKYHPRDEFSSPALCTWRVINSDNMTHDWTMKTVKKASEIGIKSFIFDDGWYGVGLDSPKMFNDMGDWPRRIENKFPDIEKTVKAMKKLDVKPILWYGPICVGKDAKKFKKVEHLLAKVRQKDGTVDLWDVGRGFYTYCPRNPEARKVMLDGIKTLLVDYDAEGLKIDLFDYMPSEPCLADHEHDHPNTTEAVKQFFKEAGELVRKLKPGALFSVKNNYGNVELAPYASVIRGGDSPYDENLNFWRSVYPSAYAPIVHNDYLIWHNTEDPQHLAVMLIKQITTGTPNFTVNVLKLPKKQEEVLKAWVAFFNDSLLPIYSKGVFGPQTHHFYSPAWERVTDNEALLTVIPPGRELKIPNRKKIYIMNATDEDTIWVKPERVGNYKAVYYNYKLEEVGSENIEICTGASLKVMGAGLTVLEKQ